MKQKPLVYFLLLTFGLLTFSFGYAQQISGKIKDVQGEPVVGASVIVKGTTQGVVTDAEGDFTINTIAGKMLSISSIGYNSVEVPSAIDMQVVLSQDAQEIDDVVVIGYGAQKTKDLTAPIATIKGSDLSKQIAANPMSALQGKMTGVQIIQSGAPGSGPSVKIRGVGSIGDYANPLYVVDGVFVDNIDFLSSNDIEDLTILKDASAAAIYGVRAANGVVLVTTRKGKTDRINISYEGYGGIQVPTNILKMTNTKQYIELLNLANLNNNQWINRNPDNYPGNTNWYKELVRIAPMHNHAVDISGGTAKTSYSVGLNYFYQEGIMNAKNDYERLNFRVRLDNKTTSWLNIGANSVLSKYDKKNPNNNAFSSAYVNAPVYNVYSDDNTAAYPVKFDSPQRYGYGNNYGNPIASAYYNNSTEDGYKLIFSTYAELVFIPEKLRFKTSYNLDFAFWNQRSYTPEHYVGGSQGSKNSSLSKTFGYSNKHIIDNILTYNDKVGESSFSILLGQSTRTEFSSWLNGISRNVPFFDEQSLYLNTGSPRNREVYDGAGRYNGLSFFARGTYNYGDKYLATLTFRADGSSKYQEKWGYFPSVGIGWVISNEEFMKSQSLLQNLKLRASWGLLGNDNVPANSAEIVGSSGVGASGVFGDNLIDGQGAQTVRQNYLKWEVVNEYNVGVDFAMLQGRLSGDIDYYYRITDNVVFYAPIATGGGVATLLGNNGSVLNHGLEVSLKWSDKVGTDFGYSVGFNATTINNKVLRLDGRDFIPGGSVRGGYATKTQVGYPIGAFWGYEVDGVYASEAEALRDPVSQIIKDAGYFKYKDQNGSKTITEEDKTYLGSAIPKAILGLDFGFTYKNLDFSILFNASLGHKILNAKRMNRDIYMDGNYDLDFYDNAWRPTRKSNTYPSAEAYNTSFIQQANDFFVEDGSFVRIQNIQIGYNFYFPKVIQKLRIYLSAQRPFSFFKYNGFTPEIGGSPIDAGIDNSVYPMQSVYTFGINLNF